MALSNLRKRGAVYLTNAHASGAMCDAAQSAACMPPACAELRRTTAATPRSVLVGTGESFYELRLPSAAPKSQPSQPAAGGAWSFSSVLESLLQDGEVQGLGRVAAAVGSTIDTLVDSGLGSLHSLVGLASDMPALASPPSLRIAAPAPAVAVGVVAHVPSPVSSWDAEWEAHPTPTPQARRGAQPLGATPSPAAPLRVTRLTPPAAAAPAAPRASTEADLSDQVRQQLHLLLTEKARLAQENARLQRENQNLQELLCYSMGPEEEEGAMPGDEEEEEPSTPVRLDDGSTGL